MSDNLSRSMAAQAVRVVDVFVIGPLTIWAGYTLAVRQYPVRGLGLASVGVATILYNANNWVKFEKATSKRRSGRR